MQQNKENSLPHSLYGFPKLSSKRKIQDDCSDDGYSSDDEKTAGDVVLSDNRQKWSAVPLDENYYPEGSVIVSNKRFNRGEDEQPPLKKKKGRPPGAKNIPKNLKAPRKKSLAKSKVAGTKTTIYGRHSSVPNIIVYLYLLHTYGNFEDIIRPCIDYCERTFGSFVFFPLGVDRNMETFRDIFNFSRKKMRLLDLENMQAYRLHVRNDLVFNRHVNLPEVIAF